MLQGLPGSPGERGIGGSPGGAGQKGEDMIQDHRGYYGSTSQSCFQYSNTNASTSTSCKL